jgi:hypothetical protein
VYVGFCIWLVARWHWLGLLAVLGMAAVMWFSALYIAPRALHRTILIPFEAKACVLEGAEITVHSFSPAAPPAEDGEEVHLLTDGGEDASTATPMAQTESLDWYLLDCTITPKEPEGPFQLWEPGELYPVRADAPAGWEFDEAYLLGKMGEVAVLQGEEWQPEDGRRFGGTQRLRLRIGIPPGTYRFCLRYYSAILGPVLVDRPQTLDAE